MDGNFRKGRQWKMDFCCVAVCGKQQPSILILTSNNTSKFGILSSTPGLFEGTKSFEKYLGFPKAGHVDLIDGNAGLCT